MAHDTKRRSPQQRGASRAPLAVHPDVGQDAKPWRRRGPQPPPGRVTAEIQLRPPRLVALTPNQEATARALLGELIAARPTSALTLAAANGLIRRPASRPEPEPPDME